MRSSLIRVTGNDPTVSKPGYLVVASALLLQLAHLFDSGPRGLLTSVASSTGLLCAASKTETETQLQFSSNPLMILALALALDLVTRTRLAVLRYLLTYYFYVFCPWL